MKWKNKRVMVTGAAGFIGSHLVETLVKQGARVCAFVRYTSRHEIGSLGHLAPDVLKEVDIYYGDLRDPDAVAWATQRTQVVFHLGALIAIPYSYLHPREVIETNVMGTVNVLNAVLRNKVERMVHTSTSEVYGTARQFPISEAHPLHGQSPYSASKIGADKIVESYCNSFDAPVTTIRPFNTYGERQSLRAVIPTIINQAIRGKIIRLGALHPTRDFTYISDTVEAFLRLAASSRAVGRVFNIGSSKEISIEDLGKTIAQLMGISLRVSQETKRFRPRKSEVERLCSDTREARRLLKWKPRVDLQTGLQRVIHWIQEHPELYTTTDYVI